MCKLSIDCAAQLCPIPDNLKSVQTNTELTVCKVVQNAFLTPAILVDEYISLFVSLMVLLLIDWIIGLIMMIFFFIVIVTAHIIGRLHHSFHKKLTINSVSRTITYEEIPVTCGCCFCTYPLTRVIHFDDVIKVNYIRVNAMNLVGQSVQFQLRRHEFLAPAIELTDQNIDTLKQLIGLDHQQDNQAIQRQVQIQPNLRYAPPQIIFQQTPYENREQEVSNYGNPYQVQQQQQYTQPSDEQQQQSSQQQQASITHYVPISLPSVQQSQNSSQSFEQGQDQHHIHPDQNQIYNEVENKEIEDKKKEIVKKQKKMNKETKIDQKHPESKNLKHKSKSHQTKKEKEKEYEKMNDNYNSENEQEKQSTDKVDDPKDADHEQLTHKGLENNSIEDAEDV